MITIDFRKQQALDADPKAIQQTNFVGDLDRDENVAMYFIVEEAKKKEKKTFYIFRKVLWNCLRGIEEMKNYFIKGLEQNELMSNTLKKVCMALKYIEHFFYFISLRLLDQFQFIVLLLLYMVFL